MDVSIFEITADDIALLNDEDLRALVARLCEAEVRAHGFSTSCVTWGGSQDAADGGIDVRVTLPVCSAIDGFVPRAATGFQVKKEDMPRSEILSEMRPKNVIRPSIQKLADQDGAYIIVSSAGSTSDKALGDRRDAMAEAMTAVPNADGLELDFYDRTRLATWLRSHEGLIPWVRELVGRAIPGWHSYGSWAHAPAPVDAPYLLDDKLRIHTGKRETDTGLSALDGIRQIRDQLRQHGHVVRLVGLSGVGKTRLVQALFDQRVGEHALDPSLAIYTNMADGPDPQPIGLASSLVLEGVRAILVIDNCPADLHQRLSELCRDPKSKLSVITIEYDVREDEPEGTEVFTLESSSLELIEKLLRQRYPNVSQVDAHTIAKFSDGNARIAIALASTVGKNDNIAGLTDEQLFRRLFLQRHASDESLYVAAQVCSLVYSFQGEDVSDSDHAELIRLARIIGVTAGALYRSIAELKRRDLVQQRSVWRAVLPPAIANRLASAALENIPYSAIEKQLVTLSSERLLKSFSRRLSNLHASKEAVAIAKKWLSAGGLLGDVEDLGDLEREMFENVASVAPEDALAAIERMLLGPTGDQAAKEYEEYIDLLRSLSYDPALFNRCIELIVKIVAARDVDHRSRGAEIFESLFQLCLSGTQATIEQRLTVAESLLVSPDVKRRGLGASALKALLEAWHFRAVSDFSFGARSRDFGYWPRSKEEVQRWFGSTLKLVETLACSDVPSSAVARAALAEKFRGLWLRSVVPDELANVCRAIAQKRFWPEGWIAIRQTLDLDGKTLDPGRRAQLCAIEAQLRPADLLQKVRSVVFSRRVPGLDLDDFEDHSSEDMATRMARTESLARDLGKAIATEEACLIELLPELVSSEGRLWSFGQGLMEGAPDPGEMWDRLVTALPAIDEKLRKPQVLQGFLNELQQRDPGLGNRLLDNAVEHETLARWYPMLQVAFGIDEEGVVRLKRSLLLGKNAAAIYSYLACGGATDPIPAPDMKDLVLTIASMESGYDVAIEVLHTRLFSDEARKQGISPELIDTGLQLIRRFAFTHNDREDYRLSTIAKSCLKGKEGAAVAQGICRKLKDAVSKHEAKAFYHDDLLVELFRVQPTSSLNGLFAGGKAELQQGIQIIEEIRWHRKNPLDVVPEDELLSWCDQEPNARYPAIAGLITISCRDKETEPLRWSGIARRLLERAPDQIEVLKGFVRQFMRSGGFSGSLAATLESSATLLDDLTAYSDPALAAFVAQEKLRLSSEIEFQRQLETAFDRKRDERFE